MRLNSWKIRLVIGYTCVATGFCFLLLTAGFGIYEAAFLSRSLEASGTVIANVEASNPDGSVNRATSSQTSLCPQFRYASQDGTTYTVTSSACAFPPTFPVDAKVRVHYLKSHPENGQIDSFGAKWGLPLGFGIACGVMLPIGIILLRRLRSQAFFEQSPVHSAR